MNGDFPLTSKQRECLTLIAEGMTDREIAECMNVKITTVREHLKEVRGKLGACNRANAVSRGYQRGELK